MRSAAGEQLAPLQMRREAVVAAEDLGETPLAFVKRTARPSLAGAEGVAVEQPPQATSLTPASVRSKRRSAVGHVHVVVSNPQSKRGVSVGVDTRSRRIATRAGRPGDVSAAMSSVGSRSSHWQPRVLVGPIAASPLRAAGLSRMQRSARTPRPGWVSRGRSSRATRRTAPNRRSVVAPPSSCHRPGRACPARRAPPRPVGRTPRTTPSPRESPHTADGVSAYAPPQNDTHPRHRRSHLAQVPTDPVAAVVLR